MAHDFQFERDQSFGEWLHREIHEAVWVEDAAWAIERAHRVEDRLQASRAQPDRLLVEIPWLEEATAFTAPGRYIYFSRRLYELCATDEQVAFVVSHEIAHHDLGHVAFFHGWANAVARLPGAALFAVFFHALECRLYGPERECQADRHGMDLCLSGGYSGERCLELLDILEQRALYLGDEDIVYGPDEESDDELDENATWKTKAQIWAWQRKRGYLPIRDRRQMLRKHLEFRSVSHKLNSVQPDGPANGSSRFAQRQMERHLRLAPVADLIVRQTRIAPHERHRKRRSKRTTPSNGRWARRRD